MTSRVDGVRSSVIVAAGLLALPFARRAHVCAGGDAIGFRGANAVDGGIGRAVARPWTLYGKTLEPGARLMFLWHCANHDEREFEDPDRFDIHRRAPRILSFGHAVHRCLGANIAPMEGRVLLQELLRRMPEYEVDAASAVRLRSEFFQGWGSLPIGA